KSGKNPLYKTQTKKYKNRHCAHISTKKLYNILCNTTLRNGKQFGKMKTSQKSFVCNAGKCARDCGRDVCCMCRHKGTKRPHAGKYKERGSILVGQKAGSLRHHRSKRRKKNAKSKTVHGWQYRGCACSICVYRRG